jgi:putative spermidine/putrescine transport system permease protein
MEITYDPSVAALSALLAFLSILIVFIAEKLLGFSKYV